MKHTHGHKHTHRSLFSSYLDTLKPSWCEGLCDWPEQRWSACSSVQHLHTRDKLIMKTKCLAVTWLSDPLVTPSSSDADGLSVALYIPLVLQESLGRQFWTCRAVWWRVNIARNWLEGLETNKHSIRSASLPFKSHLQLRVSFLLLHLKRK